MRLMLAEDGGLLRDALRRLLEAAGFEVTAAVGDADALERAVAADPPDVAIVDVRMPPTFTDEGLRAVESIKASRPDVGLLVLTQSTDPAHAIRLLRDGRGGVGYLLKDRVADLDELADAIRRIGRGGNVVDPSVVRLLIDHRAEHDPLQELTPREREVLGLIAEGRSNRGIAERLVVGEKTVETHVAAILGKLGLEAAPDDHRRVLAVLTYLRLV
jgi:DNA-binding NarL/FixJ family response regulator